MKNLLDDFEIQIYIDAIKNGYLISDSQTNKIINCNKAFEELTNYTKSELLDLDVKTLYYNADSNENFLRNISIIKKNNDKVICDIDRTFHKNNITISIFKKLESRDELEIAKQVIEALNIKFNKIIKEQDLKNQFLDTLLETIPAPLFAKDKDFKYNYCNQAFLDFLGKERKDIIGKNVWDLSPKDLADKYHEADLSVIKDEKQIYDSQVVYADGSRHKIVFHKSIYKNENDEFSGMIGLIVDNTEKIELLEELKNKTKQLNDFVTASTDFVWEVDANGIYTYASKGVKDFLGYEPEEIIGKTPFELMSEKEAANIGSQFLNILKNKQVIKDMMNWNIHKNGNEILFLTNGVPIYDQDGNLAGYRGTDKDITKEYKRQNELREKDILILEQSKMSAMGEMIGNIAHQWRQPLSLISTAASGLELKYNLGDLNKKEIKEMTELIISSTKYLSKTIDTFRNYIRGEKNTVPTSVENEIIQVKDIVDALLKSSYIKLKDSIDYSNTNIINIIPGELPQIIINILQNAKDALLEKKIKEPWIEINLTRQKNKIVITIEDNAGGIDEKIISKIFEPYFTTKHQSQGTGLGLHMSYRLVTESLGGNIYVKNTANGAKFFIELPID